MNVTFVAVKRHQLRPPIHLSLFCRDEIAGCIEKAYEQIQFAEATRVLFFSSPKKMTEYAKKVGISSHQGVACFSLTQSPIGSIKGGRVICQ